MAWSQKFSKAHIIIIASGVLAFTSTFAYLNSLDKKVEIARLKHSVIAGEVISKSDVEFISVKADPKLDNLIITKDRINEKVFVSRLDLKKSDFLTNSNTSRRSTNSGLQSLSITLEIGRANGGDIIAGDIIDIYQTGDDSHLVAKSIQVRSIKKPSDHLGISTTKDLTIVIAINQIQANELSRIIGSNDIMVVLSTGSDTISKAIDQNGEFGESTTTTIPPNGEYTPIDLSNGG